MKFTLLAAATVLAVPAAFAQNAPADETTYLVSAGSTLSPSNSPVSQRPLPGGAIAEQHAVVPVVALNGSGSNTAVMGAAPAAGNRYWFNVPRDIGQRADFSRWLGLQ